jgi:hypothetical protein
MSGLTASSLPAVCGVVAVICTWSAWKRATQHRYRHAATASWWTERNLIQLSRFQVRQGRLAKEKVAERAQDYNGKDILFQPHYSRTIENCDVTPLLHYSHAELKYITKTVIIKHTF